MALSIKHKDSDRLVGELIRLTGETKTQAVVVALRERLARETKRHQKKALAEELIAIGRRCASQGKAKPISHAQLLYDENGLPQ
ncbi:MAG: hypothetical protein A2341_03880 [Deltaproteobacteria bacterium RIFOXYB12_FULL_58_9]|nr:MAG: hypothetical protein A2341_03880 [Deltaproteobacteria bacterium RIFOXYB12_FULL_58_9]